MPHGDAIREWLASILCSTAADSESAWREHEARRRFAQEILAMMDAHVPIEHDPADPRDENAS